MTFPWDTYTERLKALCAEGLSAGRIADVLSAESGCECSRNSVVGKLNRLGIALLSGATNQNSRGARKPKPSRITAALFAGYRPGRQLPAPREEPAVTLSTDQTAVTLVPEQPTRCTIMDLDDFPAKARKCRWPEGDPRNPDFHFCGGKTITGLPYCGYHAGIAYRPV